jgi:alpha-tubulin suppressor-like RCC1 family protein
VVPGLPPIVSLTVNNFAVCALSTTGARYCWGNNSEGELGDGTQTNQLSPELIP